MINRGGFRFGGETKRSIERLFLTAVILCFFIFNGTVSGEIGPENLLILVNSQSPTSCYVAKLYRQYYPAIEDYQVLSLDGLTDCSGPGSSPADEIITRDQYENCIAGPVRQYLLNNNLAEQVIVIVTTAGMPYRIEDADYEDVIYPAGSNYNTVLSCCENITAASVESELTCLWFTDYGNYSTDAKNRIVNPYQGYRNSSISMFEREFPCTKPILWNTAVNFTETAPKMEGEIRYTWPFTYGTINRKMHAGDIYLTCRLDGPKAQGKSAVFAVREILERSKRASSANYGVNAAYSAIVIDDCPGKTLDQNRVYNLDGSMNYYVYSNETPQPPGAPTTLTMDDYTEAFESLTNGTPVASNGLSTGFMDSAYGLKVLLDRRVGTRTTHANLDPEDLLLYLCCYGKNGDEGSVCDYLINDPSCGTLFIPANGAVFTSIESFNAVTMFSDVQTNPTAQGKIIDFITIGGTGAIGHAFEPLTAAAIDNVFLSYNLFSDMDGDGTADLTFIEAAFTAIPFLSWSEVVIGDPLMRIQYTDNIQKKAWKRLDADINCDKRVNYMDIYLVNSHFGGSILPGAGIDSYNKYNDLGDVDRDSRINYWDIMLAKQKFGTVQE